MNNINIGLEKISEFVRKIRQSENIVIVPHVNPDGDAIGSVLALYIAIRKVNSSVRIVSPGDYPNFLKFLPESNVIEIYRKKSENLLKNADLLIAADFNELGRMGELADYFDKSSAFKILIDHHPMPTDFTDIVFSDINVSSTAELVYNILKNSELADFIDKECAVCLYAGIMTDTGSFNFNSSRPDTFRVVAELLEKGVDKDDVFAKVYDSFSINRMRFLGHTLLNRMTYLPEYRTAFVAISAQDRKDYKEQIGDTENFVNYPLSIEGVVFSAIFIERENFIKISFRSKGDFSAGDFAAKHFNGGGHNNASGGESKSSLKETTDKFLKILEEYREELLKQ